MIELIKAHDINGKYINVVTDDTIPLTYGMSYVFYSIVAERWEYFIFSRPIGELVRKVIIMFLP